MCILRFLGENRLDSRSEFSEEEFEVAEAEPGQPILMGDEDDICLAVCNKFE